MSFSGLISGPSWVRLTVVNAVPGEMTAMRTGRNGVSHER